jgi:hypothetical protein
MDLTIAVPDHYTKTFENCAKKGRYFLKKKQVLVFQDQSALRIKFTQEMRKSFLGFLNKRTKGAEYVTREDVVNAISDLSRSRQTDFYMDPDVEPELLEWVKNDYNKFIDNQELKIFFRTLDGVKAIEDILVENSKIEKNEIVNLWNVLKEFEQKNGRATQMKDRKSTQHSESDSGSLGVTIPVFKIPVGIGISSSEKDVINGDKYMQEDTTHSDSTYELREGDEIVITARGLDLVHTNTVRAMLKDSYTFNASQGKGKRERTYISMPLQYDDQGIPVSIKLNTLGGTYYRTSHPFQRQTFHCYSDGAADKDGLAYRTQDLFFRLPPELSDFMMEDNVDKINLNVKTWGEIPAGKANTAKAELIEDGKVLKVTVETYTHHSTSKKKKFWRGRRWYHHSSYISIAPSVDLFTRNAARMKY